MKIETYYSHLNGLEFLLVHKPKLWKEIDRVIADADATICLTKVSKEIRTSGKAIRSGFAHHNWNERRISYWVTSDANLIRNTMLMGAPQQRAEIEHAGLTPLPSYNQTDFVKERVAVEVQFGKYAFIFVGDVIDVGVEILPMKKLQQEMSSEGRGVPAVPLILIGVVP